MNPHTRSILKAWRRSAESGFDISIQTIYYVAALFLFFALIYDIGGAGYVYTVASNAARIAAQDAAKNLDLGAFLDGQEVRLSPDALVRAQELIAGLTEGEATITALSISRQQERDVIIVRASIMARLPVLGSVFGLHAIPISVEGYAEPAYGIDEEGQ
jgi:hypothetical protein